MIEWYEGDGSVLELECLSLCSCLCCVVLSVLCCVVLFFRPFFCGGEGKRGKEEKNRGHKKRDAHGVCPLSPLLILAQYGPQKITRLRHTVVPVAV